MNRIIIPVIARAKNFAVFSLFFCLRTFAAAVFAFAAAAAALDETFFTILNESRMNLD